MPSGATSNAPSDSGSCYADYNDSDDHPRRFAASRATATTWNTRLYSPQANGIFSSSSSNKSVLRSNSQRSVTPLSRM